jgi:hypothetical protein
MNELAIARPGGISVFALASEAESLVSALGDTEVIYQPPAPGKGSALKHLRAVVELHRQQGIRPPRFDAALYTGSGRKTSDVPPTDDWVASQLKSGVMVARTNSGYVAEDAEVGEIRAILLGAAESASKHGAPVEAVVPLHHEWLTHRLDELVPALSAFDGPVSLLVGHARDPFSTQKSVRGLVSILGARQLALDRSDLSAIGAVAFGASRGSIGTSGSLRHVYPPSDSSGPTQKSEAVLVPRLVAWRSLTRVRLASIAVDRPDIWVCLCSIHQGGSVGGSIHTERDRLVHNLETAGMLATEILDSPDPRSTLLSKIDIGQYYSLELAALLHDESWGPQSFLGAWRSALVTSLQQV